MERFVGGKKSRSKISQGSARGRLGVYTHHLSKGNQQQRGAEQRGQEHAMPVKVVLRKPKVSPMLCHEGVNVRGAVVQRAGEQEQRNVRIWAVAKGDAHCRVHYVKAQQAHHARVTPRHCVVKSHKSLIGSHVSTLSQLAAVRKELLHKGGGVHGDVYASWLFIEVGLLCHSRGSIVLHSFKPIIYREIIPVRTGDGWGQQQRAAKCFHLTLHRVE